MGGPPETAAITFSRGSLVRFIVRTRSLLETRLSKDIYHMPALDMLLEFYARATRSPMSITDLCLATRASQRTAVRHIERLEKEGMLIRRGDSRDRRRVMLELTPLAVTTLDQFFDDVLASLVHDPP